MAEAKKCDRCDIYFQDTKTSRQDGEPCFCPKCIEEIRNILTDYIREYDNDRKSVDNRVLENCCAGTAPEKHKTALEVVKSCQIDVI